MYDRLIRRFQSPAERKEDAKKKGYAGVLEADLWRGEAKLEALREKDGYSSSVTVTTRKKEAMSGGESTSESDTGLIIGRKQMFDFIDDDDEDEPRNKADGEKMWRKEIERRFVAGRDEDFEEYDDVDDGRWDDGLEEEREEEEKWFDEEEERCVSEEEELDDDDDGKLEKEKEKEKNLKGETGVQDF